MPLLERVAVKLAAVLALLAGALEKMRFGDIVDGLLTAVSKLVVQSEPA
ncbi:MAG: hypothetical protein H7Y61_12180, partial [Rhizobiales bacterium]|nr:hypothetical protein [Rhizobacter sp.]